MKLKISLYFIGLVSLGFATYFTYPKFTQQKVTQGTQINLEIKKLWAANEEERQGAKKNLFQFGRPSIPPLISLLEDLIKHPGNQYALGKTEKDFLEVTEQINSSSTPKEKEAALKLIREILIDQRIKADVCELLGALQAAEAIPILIEAMEKEEGSSGDKELMNPAMYTLVQIGESAVPKLIEAIETAGIREASVRYGDGAQPSEFAIKVETLKDQTRASMVLGEIGDKNALPTLERLLLDVRFRDGVTKYYVEEAIKKIKKKNDLN